MYIVEKRVLKKGAEGLVFAEFLFVCGTFREVLVFAEFLFKCVVRCRVQPHPSDHIPRGALVDQQGLPL